MLGALRKKGRPSGGGPFNVRKSNGRRRNAAKIRINKMI